MRNIRSDNLTKKNQETVDVTCVDTGRVAKAHVLNHNQGVLTLAMNTVKITLHQHKTVKNTYVGSMMGMTFECQLPD